MRLNFIILITLIQNILCKYIPSKQVEIGWDRPLQFGQKVLSQTIDETFQKTYSYKNNFSRKPQILIAYNLLDLAGSQQLNPNLQITTQDITNNKFTVKINKFKDQKIFSVAYFYLVIDSDDAYVVNNQIADFKNLSKIQNNVLIAKIKLEYKRKDIDPKNSKRIMSCYLTGYNQINPDTKTNKITIFLEIIQYQDYAELTIQSDQINLGIQEIYYNYIEYYEDLNDNLFKVDYFQERQYRNTKNGAILDAYNKKLSIQITPQLTDITNESGILYGINGFEFDQNMEVSRLRLNKNKLDISTSLFSYSYTTWSDTSLNGFTSDIIIFKQLECDIYYNKNCIKQCPDQTYFKNNDILRVGQCFQCHISCKSCKGSENNKCLECYEGYILKNGFCVEKIDPYYDETVLNVMNSSADITSKTTLGITAFLTLASNITKSGNSLINYLFTVQKVLYLLLINIAIPQYFLDFLEILTENRILNQFDHLNPFYSFKDTKNQYIGQKFKDENIPSSIITNCGGGFIVLVIIILCNYGFYYSQIFKKKNIFLMIYEKAIVQTISTYIILIIPIFSLGLYIQMSHFFDYGESELFYIKIILIILIHPIIVFVLIYIYNSLRIPDHTFCIQIETCMCQFSQIWRDTLLNGCIKQSIYTRLYMLIYIIIEGYLFPLLIISGRNNFQFQIISLVLLQFLETIITCILRPFLDKIDNYQYCAEQLLWNLVFILFAFLSYNLQDITPKQVQYDDKINHLILAISIILLIIIAINPIVQIIKLIKFALDYLKQRKLNQSKDNQSYSRDTTITLQMLQQQKSFDQQNNQYMFQYYKQPIQTKNEV